MRHAERSGGPVAAAQNCATDGPLSVATRGQGCTAWSVVKHATLTPRNYAISIGYSADRRPTTTPNNIERFQIRSSSFPGLRLALGQNCTPNNILAGEHAVSARREPVADELLQAQLAKLQRKNDAITAERRRLVDLYQAALIDREKLLRRSKEVQDRKQSVEQQCDALIAQRKELARQNALRERIIGF